MRISQQSSRNDGILLRQPFYNFIVNVARAIVRWDCASIDAQKNTGTGSERSSGILVSKSRHGELTLLPRPQRLRILIGR